VAGGGGPRPLRRGRKDRYSHRTGGGSSGGLERTVQEEVGWEGGSYAVPWSHRPVLVQAGEGGAAK